MGSFLKAPDVGQLLQYPHLLPNPHQPLTLSQTGLRHQHGQVFPKYQPSTSRLMTCVRSVLYSEAMCSFSLLLFAVERLILPVSGLLHRQSGG